MAKAKSKTASKRKPAVAHGPKPIAQRSAKPSSSAKSVVKTSTKHDRVLEMLRSAQGATIDAMMKETDWQKHSVRGFLAGVVRKRLGLDLASDNSGPKRIYRVQTRPTPSKGLAAPAA